MFFIYINNSYDVRTYKRRLGLTKPTVGKYSINKKYVDVLLSNDNLLLKLVVL